MEMDDDPVIPLAAGLAASLEKGDVVSITRGQASFNFILDWNRKAAIGRLTFRIGAVDLWSYPLDLPGVASLIRGLAGAWEALSVEETYPHSVTLDHPSQLGPQLDSLIKDVDEVDLLLDEYRLSHDLAAWIDNPDAASLWFMREGLFMIVESGATVRRLPGGEVLRLLEQLGDTIGELIRGVEPTVIMAWQDRNDTSPEALGRLLRLSIGRSSENVQQLLDSKIIPFPARRSDVMLGLDEVLVAARMWPATAFSVTELQRVATEIRAIPHRETLELDRLAEEARLTLERHSDRPPRVDGIAIAEWLRKRLGMKSSTRAEPEHLLQQWRVFIRRVPILRDIEAVSFWGGQHGPGILLNPTARKAAMSERDGAIRFTLAHEICHLLLDRKGSLPVAEVLGGTPPNRPEKRANVFAAHFLLPLEEVQQVFSRSTGINECLESLMEDFGVSRTLAAAQIKWRYYRSDSLSPADWRIINALAPS